MAHGMALQWPGLSPGRLQVPAPSWQRKDVKQSFAPPKRVTLPLAGSEGFRTTAGFGPKSQTGSGSQTGSETGSGPSQAHWLLRISFAQRMSPARALWGAAEAAHHAVP